MKKILFLGHDIRLHLSGIAFLNQHDTAVVSDLHLEKGSFFATHGQLLPPYDSLETLSRLKNILNAENIKKLIFLGDVFHDRNAYARLPQNARAIWDALTRLYDVIFVRGNHDADAVFPFGGVHICDEYWIGNLVLRHQACPSPDTAGEISGHFHPKATLSPKGAAQALSYACFIETPTRIFLPAFGAYTGGLDHAHPALQSLTGRQYYLHLLGRQGVHTLPYSAAIS